MNEAGSSDAVELHTDEGTIATTYRCVVVRSYDDQPLFALVPPNNPLVEVLDSGEAANELLILTADQWGPFSVTTRLLNSQPVDPGSEWEDVVDMSITTPTGLMVTELVGNEPRIQLVSEPGEYRLRVSGRGRSIPDNADDEDGEEIAKEWYRLEVWPAPRADPVVVRLTSPWAERTERS